MALIAAGAAAISLGLIAVPASADQVRHQEWWLSSLGVTSAWSASQGAGVTVAVLSDGVDASQADLAGAVTTSAAISGAPVASGQYAGEQGTPIASLIAGRGHGSGGGAGIIGVAPEARILSVPVTLPPDDPQLGLSSVAAAIPASIAAGIRYAVSHGATVIDLPIDPGQAGSNGIAGMSAAAGGSAAEQAAISYATAHNVVLVAPAGDDEAAGDAPNYPAAYPGVIAVGAFDSAFDKAPWSQPAELRHADRGRRRRDGRRQRRQLPGGQQHECGERHRRRGCRAHQVSLPEPHCGRHPQGPDHHHAVPPARRPGHRIGLWRCGRGPGDDGGRRDGHATV